MIVETKQVVEGKAIALFQKLEKLLGRHSVIQLFKRHFDLKASDTSAKSDSLSPGLQKAFQELFQKKSQNGRTKP
jgi:hypothetical protein